MVGVHGCTYIYIYMHMYKAIRHRRKVCNQGRARTRPKGNIANVLDGVYLDMYDTRVMGVCVRSTQID